MDSNWLNIGAVLLALGGALGSVLKSNLEIRSKRKKALVDAYQEFLDAFSKPMPCSHHGRTLEPECLNYELFLAYSGDYLKAALKVIEFEKIIVLPQPKRLHLPSHTLDADTLTGREYWERDINSLNMLIQLILELRYTRELGQNDKIGYMEKVRELGIEEFGELLLESLKNLREPRNYAPGYNNPMYEKTIGS